MLKKLNKYIFKILHTNIRIYFTLLVGATIIFKILCAFKFYDDLMILFFIFSNCFIKKALRGFFCLCISDVKKCFQNKQTVGLKSDRYGVSPSLVSK